MKNITRNEMLFILSIFKSPEKEYNARNLAPKIGISRMGCLKIANRLIAENIITSRNIGNAKIYKMNFKNYHTRQYLRFLLQREAEQSQIRSWVWQFRRIKNAQAAIIFGSVLHKRDPNDIDLLLITKQKNFEDLKKEIERLNLINIKPIHPIYQSYSDWEKNIRKMDPVLLGALKGVYVFGEDVIIDGLSQ
jgi:predicted nucleotidyltransferase